jgi:hypothetical protein
MLIMQAAYVMASKDKSQLLQYYDVFRGWAEFLETEALYPRDQVSSDDFQGVSQCFEPSNGGNLTLIRTLEHRQ